MNFSNNKVTQGGGIFHPAKVKYSPDTERFIKDLLTESKLSMMQRKQLNYSLRSGEPLRTPTEEPKKKTTVKEVVTRPRSSKRRMYSSIVDSGAYERDKFVPLHPKVNRDEAKLYLQDLMAYGKTIKNIYKPKAKPKPESEKTPNRFDELKQEIKERTDWLAEMEELGEGYKHRQLIEQQIAERIREMKNMKIKEQEKD